MNFFTRLTLVSVIAALGGCQESMRDNKAGLTEETYEASETNGYPMVFPAGSKTVFKAGGTLKEATKPQPFQHPNKWVVYMASPGWTNGGENISNRLAFDAAAIYRVRQFIFDNGLQDRVKVAWLQYDDNPSSQYVESLDDVPDNFIPLFLKMHGPKVDYYIHSPTFRRGARQGAVRYDQWLKPYLFFAKKEGNDYVAANTVQINAGFNDIDGKYWDNWARHWFVVNPEGKVADAYFSNLGVYHIQAPDKPINSLIHHLALQPADLKIPKIVSSNYKSFFTQPYWDKIDAEVRTALDLEVQ